MTNKPVNHSSHNQKPQPAGNYFNKYTSNNPLVKYHVNGFKTSLQSLLSQITPSIPKAGQACTATPVSLENSFTFAIRSPNHYLPPASGAV